MDYEPDDFELMDYEDEAQNDTIAAHESCPNCGDELVYSFVTDSVECFACGWSENDELEPDNAP